ncbi:E2 [Trichechus manatus latirostris papillomavirus 3]|uniref:Regulatory protein E2 n=1 Tax=Trichechus manatus latirostris papillomavirus 3 TaxID=2848316 RepID=A0A0F6RB75_9PAPI|nr:E2 [Trichechus manatus latirostris papillomavirus 3]AKE50899.1 E2 [Trichechus manatus latirostris papillomavirus 3]
METLLKRLGVVQDEMMDLFELDSDLLRKQIDYWKCIKMENLIFYYARKNNITRLGYNVVPTLAVAENKAKESIELLVVLDSLRNSPYAQESWTLRDTSRERWLLPPRHCLKKGAIPIDVRYDGEKDNVMSYTGWAFIYYQNYEDVWQKVQGHVDYDGAYYFDGGHKCYYIYFDADAQRYSKTKQWEVHYKHEVFSPVTPVTSSTPDDLLPETEAHCPITSTPGREQSPERPAGPATAYTVTYSPTPAAGAPTSTTPTTCQKWRTQEEEDPKGKRRRCDEEEGPWDQRPDCDSECRGTADPDSDFEPERRPGCKSQRLGTGKTKGRGTARGQRGRGAARCITAGGGDVDSRRVGVTSGFPDRPASDGLSRGVPIPILLIAGGANQLKCLRYRWRRKPRPLFTEISCTWTWATRGEDAGGRLLLSFDSEHTRTEFLQTVHLPSGVTAAYGSLDAL